jgi:hypothetical protein
VLARRHRERRDGASLHGDSGRSGTAQLIILLNPSADARLAPVVSSTPAPVLRLNEFFAAFYLADVTAQGVSSTRSKTPGLKLKLRYGFAGDTALARSQTSRRTRRSEKQQQSMMAFRAGIRRSDKANEVSDRRDHRE